MPAREIKNKDADYLQDNLQRNVLLHAFDHLTANVLLHNEPRTKNYFFHNAELDVWALGRIYCQEKLLAHSKNPEKCFK